MPAAYSSHQFQSIRGGKGRRDAERGDKNEWRRRRRREIYSVIETVMGFVRSTCQGQVKTASVRVEERDERMG